MNKWCHMQVPSRKYKDEIWVSRRSQGCGFGKVEGRWGEVKEPWTCPVAVSGVGRGRRLRWMMPESQEVPLGPVLVGMTQAQGEEVTADVKA